MTTNKVLHCFLSLQSQNEIATNHFTCNRHKKVNNSIHLNYDNEVVFYCGDL